MAGARPIWPRRPSRANKGKVNLFAIGVDAATEAVYARLKVVPPGAGSCHFPLGRDTAWFEQLTAERVRTRYVKGFPQRYWWKPDGRRNEALDTRVYAYAALHGLIAMGLSLNARAAALPVPQAKTTPSTPVVAIPASPRRRRAIASTYMQG